MRVALLTSLLALTACNESALELPKKRDAAPAKPVVAAPKNVHGVVKRVESKSDVPLIGPRVDAKPGDYLLTSDGVVAVVSQKRGAVVDFGAEGEEDIITGIHPIAATGLSPLHSELAWLGPSEDGASIHLILRVLDKPLLVHAFVAIDAGVLRVESVIEAGATGVSMITLGEEVGWGNTPTWVEGQGFVRSGGAWGTEFLAREGRGGAAALCSLGGRMMARFGAQDAPGFYEEAQTGEVVTSLAPMSLSPRRTIRVARDKTSMGAAVARLGCPRVASPHVVEGPALAAEETLEIARCPELPDESPKQLYARFGAGPVALPEGCFVGRVTSPGVGAGRWSALDKLAKAERAPEGTLAIDARSSTDEPLPSTLVLRGLDGTPTPDFGEDRDDGAAKNLIHELGAAKVTLLAGKYRVIVHRGFEYELFDKVVTIEPGKVVTLTPKLARVVDTAGYAAADLHVHAIASPDAPTPLEARIKSLSAVGVEIAVATDHNAVTDYAPTIAKMNLGAHVASVVGDEVTTRDVPFGHVNAFPIAPSSQPIEYEATSPARLFAAARAAAPSGASNIVQINHPRMGSIGYFELLRMDEHDVRGWLARAPVADLGFDALEVFNGDHYDAIPKVERAMRDWFALLDAGFRDTATGNSDSHKAGYQDCGAPRTYLALAHDAPKDFDPKELVAAIRGHHAIVSSGPFVQLFAQDQPVGAVVAPGKVSVRVKVDAPSWIDVSRVELIKRGHVIRTWEGKELNAKKITRLEVTESIELDEGDWLIAVARGDKPMPHLYRDNAMPYAFTNPVWISAKSL
jgi:hypothetical protein